MNEWRVYLTLISLCVVGYPNVISTHAKNTYITFSYGFKLLRFIFASNTKNKIRLASHLAFVINNSRLFGISWLSMNDM